MDDKKLELPEDFINSIRDLNALCSQQEDSAVAMLYRLMFRHERNIDILDSYADRILMLFGDSAESMRKKITGIICNT